MAGQPVTARDEIIACITAALSATTNTEAGGEPVLDVYLPSGLAVLVANALDIEQVGWLDPHFAGVAVTETRCCRSAEPLIVLRGATRDPRLIEDDDEWVAALDAEFRPEHPVDVPDPIDFYEDR